MKIGSKESEIRACSLPGRRFAAVKRCSLLIPPAIQIVESLLSDEPSFES